jgi:hypothetical protein
MLAAIFIASGWGHVTKPAERAKSIDLSKVSPYFWDLPS